ncbi:MAG: carboxymuconolactone decarboxylase family protein [Myxococcota bacterium]|nr:carboxymuconolactone decarboxylase family protein [Myxococcota bacterium]
MTWLPETAPGADPFARVFGLRPNLFDAWKQFEALLWQDKRVDPVVLELCRLRLAGMNGAAYGRNRRAPAAVEAGLEEAKIAALDHWWKTDLYSATEQACLRFAEQFALDPGEITDAVARPVVEALGEPGTVAFVEALAIFDGFSRFSAILGIAPAGDAP